MYIRHVRRADADRPERSSSLLTSGALKTLRDLRIDLFASLERKPASFYDHVAVGRVMTRVTNDVENLFELLVGFVGRAGVLCPVLRCGSPSCSS